MRARQWRSFDSLVRVRVFLTELVPRGTLSFGHALGKLDEAIATLRGFAANQYSAPARTRAEAARQKDLISRLLVDHMAPIVTITRSQMEPEKDPALPTMFRMPRGRVTVVRAIVISDAMMVQAAPLSDLLIAEGMPPDWLARFKEARDALVASQPRRAKASITGRTATAGIEVALRRGRLALGRLDALMRATYHGDDAMLAAWRQAKRVQLR
ncbi:MAG: hypothetical protein IT357_08385 [Gemmatimonadaceae bacterium]|nr:hypothetical protein [Gemmatimonadaceae bacterium]